MSEKFSTQERKKEFDKIYKNKILPFFEQEGYRQVTQASKRLYKELGHGLSVYIYFEYRTFGSGFYNMSIAYYDDEIGKEPEDSPYLAAPRISIPTLKGNSVEELNRAAELWLGQIKSTVIGFINQHADHRAILNSTVFHFPIPLADHCKALLERKAADN